MSTYYGYIIPIITTGYTLLKYYELYKRIEYVNSLIEPKLWIYKGVKYFIAPSDPQTPIELKQLTGVPPPDPAGYFRG